VLAGNIGKPVFEIVGEINADTIVILELSCHQLENCRHSPAIAVLLNVFEDHLDRYVTFEKYVMTKKNIFLHQQMSDILYCTEDTKPLHDEAPPHTQVIDKRILPFASLNDLPGVRIHGNHNLSNCAFVYEIARTYGVTDEEFIAALTTFPSLPHRCEWLGTQDGIDYYNDSISTTAESTICSLQSLTNVATILIGGMDRGINYDGLISFLVESELNHIICMSESGERIHQMLLNWTPSPIATVHYCADFTAAVMLAKRVTPHGMACLLSPAAASYLEFKNFAERGERFKKLIFEDK
jgi:UDP-N-acetylmuramoylalanine--D-glutamate ligase